MANYKEVDVVGKQWNRAGKVIIDNPLNGTPYILFMEDTVTSVGQSETVTKFNSNLYGNFEPSKQIPLINPETGEAIGSSVTHAELYVILHSLYLQLATERDASME